ncbi:MAG: YqhA family protein [Gammaproteobacteria bacterium]|nr:YqhA family protein [Gammaproteobacteria bacterium]
MEKIFAGVLWNSRLVVLAAVVASLAASFGMFYMASVDAFYMISHLLHYASPELTGAERVSLRSATVTHVVEIVDGYLLATVLLIFAMGLYELFVKKIEQAGDEEANNVLMISSLDDLKSRLAKVVMMILVVRYFEFALQMDFQTPLDLLQFAGGIALLGLALYLAHLADKDSH